MLLCGGAIFVINGDRDGTEDIDCMIDKHGILYNIRIKLACEFSIDENWVNTEVEDVFKLSRVPKSEWEWFDNFTRLTVYKVSNKVLLAMKVAAARERKDKSDLPDTVTLLNRMELTSYDEALEVIECVREMT